MTTTQAIAEVAAKVKTIDQALALLAAATKLLREGYDQLERMPGSVADATRSLLDQANAYAQRIYTETKAAKTLDPKLRNKVAWAYVQASNDRKAALDSANTDYVDLPGLIPTIKLPGFPSTGIKLTTVLALVGAVGTTLYLYHEWKGDK